MDYNNYGSRGAPRILTSFGLMLASGLDALSRLLYGICDPRRGDGYPPRDNGGSQFWNMDNGAGQFRNRDDGYTPRDNGGSQFWNMDNGAGQFRNQDGGYAPRQENGRQQYGAWRVPR